MTETAALLLKTFESLAPQEKHEVLTEMLRRSGELPETFLTDDDLVGRADSLFQSLDEEELNQELNEHATCRSRWRFDFR